jgi:uncharacterized delta-60 repeat protein
MIYGQIGLDFYRSTTPLVYTLSLQADRKILVGATSNPQRLNADGSIDSNFEERQETFPSVVYTSAVQEDGTILLGGNSGSFSGTPGADLARYRPDGTLDLAFQEPPHLAGSVFGLCTDADGRILSGGLSLYGAFQIGDGLQRLNHDGSLDSGFQSMLGGIPFSIVVQTDGQILVGGDFVIPGSDTRTNVARLNQDGSIDTSFIQVPFSAVETMVLQSDGTILASAHSFPLTSRSSLLYRLKNDGSIAPGFHFELEGTVYAVAVQADGRIIVGGNFANVQSNAQCSLVRLNANGSLDRVFTELKNACVYSLALQHDGKILAGGSRQVSSSQSEGFIARIANDVPATESLFSNGSSVTWLRGGSCPDFSRCKFQMSTNGVDWVELGGGKPVAGGWGLEGVTVPPGAKIRGRGWPAVGNYNGPCWFVENTAETPSDRPVILVNDVDFGIHGSQFGFRVLGKEGLQVALEATNGEGSWASLITNTLTASPTWLIDPEPATNATRFYRVKVLP